jgi:hypothetical protein
MHRYRGVMQHMVQGDNDNFDCITDCEDGSSPIRFVLLFK